jgi:PEP-CTERM motif
MPKEDRRYLMQSKNRCSVMKKLLRFAVFVIVALAVGRPAGAATIYVTENEMGPFGTNTYNGGTLGWSSFFSAGNGQMNLTANAGSSPALPTFTLPVWCIDQPGFIGLGLNPSETGTPIIYSLESLATFTTDFSGHSITPTQASQIAALANIGDQTLSASPNNPNNAIFSNAVQAAMTDIEYGSTSDGGAAVNAETANLLTLVQGLTPTQLAGYNATILVSQNAQQLITSASVPEPASVSLLGAGLAGLILLRRAWCLKRYRARG